MNKIFTTMILLALCSSALAANDISSQEAQVLISKFYSTYVLQDEGSTSFLDNRNASNWGTPNFLEKLKADYEFECETDDCYAAYALRTSAQDGNGSSGVISITPRPDGWYRVNYRDMGWKGVTDVKVVSVNGIPKLDDYKFISSNVK